MSLVSRHPLSVCPYRVSLTLLLLYQRRSDEEHEISIMATKTNVLTALTILLNWHQTDTQGGTGMPKKTYLSCAHRPPPKPIKKWLGHFDNIGTVQSETGMFYFF